MKAWRLDRLGGTLRLEDAPSRSLAPAVVVKVEASALMSYLKAYVEGRLPIYSPPDGPFTPGGNAIGTVHAIGLKCITSRSANGSWSRRTLSRAKMLPEPAQFLLGITAGPAGKSLQADWRDGTLAEYAHVPSRALRPSKVWTQSAPLSFPFCRDSQCPSEACARAFPAGETIVVTGRDRRIWKRGRAPLARAGRRECRCGGPEQVGARSARATRRSSCGRHRAFGRRRSRRQGAPRRRKRRRTYGL